MKKFFVAASLLALTFGAFAQDSGTQYKPVAGDVTAEVGITGGLGNTSLGLNNLGNGGQLKFRYFLADQLAVRLGFNASSTSKTDQISNGAATNPSYGTVKGTIGAYQFNLGIEKHFSGTGRLSTYAGADLLLSFQSLREKGSNVTFAKTYNNTSSYDIKGALLNSSLGTGNPAGTGVGLRLVAGADYYIVPKVYLGAEMGWGFLASSVKDITVNSTTAGVSTSSTTKGGSSFNLNPSVVGAIRLGFRF